MGFHHLIIADAHRKLPIRRQCFMAANSFPGSILLRFGLVAFILIVLSGTWLGYDHYQDRQTLRHNLRLQAQQWTGSLAIAGVDAMVSKRYQQLQQQLKEQLLQGSASYLAWQDRTGKTIAQAPSNPQSHPISANRDGEFWREGGLYLQQPVYHGGEIIGRFLAVFPLEAYQAVLKEAEIEALLAFAFLALAIITLLSLTALSISRPIKGIAHLLKRIRLDDNQLDLNLPLTGPGELQHLTQAINKVAEKVDFKLEKIGHFQRDLDTIFGRCPFPMIIVDRSGRVEKVNKAALLLFQRHPSQMLLMPIDSLFRQGDFSLMLQAVHSREGEPAFATTIRPTPKTLKIVELYLTPYPGLSGKRDATMVMVTDVTPQLNLQQDLVKEQVDISAKQASLEQHYRRLVPQASTSEKLISLLNFSEALMLCKSEKKALALLAETFYKHLDCRFSTIYLSDRRQQKLRPRLVLPASRERQLTEIPRSARKIWTLMRQSKAVHCSSATLSPAENLALGLSRER